MLHDLMLFYCLVCLFSTHIQRFLLVCAGNGGFIIVSANATAFQSDFFTLGSLFSQCTITAFADKTKAPIISDNCALGQPNACCSAPNSSCYR
jgi:hypothetical protein